MTAQPSVAVRRQDATGHTPPSGRLVVSHRYLAALWVLIVSGLALGVYDLGVKSLWLDEAVSHDYVTRGLGTLWTVISGGDPNMSLYYVSLDAWLRVFGTSEVALRSLSVLCGVLAIPVLAALGRRLFGELEGIAAGALFVLNPFILQYEQTARSYAMVTLLVLLSVYFFVLELEDPSRLSAAGLVLASALAVYAHYFAVLVLLVEVLAAFVMRGRSALNRRWLLIAAVLALAVSPEIVAMESGASSGGVPGLSGLSWIPHASLAQLPTFVWAVSGKDAILAALLGAFALYATWLGLRASRGRRWPAALTATWFLVPVALTFLISLIKPLFVDYYLIVTLPALLMLAAVGIVRAPVRAVSVVGLAAVLGLSAYSLASWYGERSQEDFRSAALYMSTHRRAGDAYIAWPSYAAAPLDYYLLRDRTIGLILPAPATSEPPGARPPRIWLVVRESDAQRVPAQFAAAALTIEKGYAVRATATFSGVEDILLGACAPARKGC